MSVISIPREQNTIENFIHTAVNFSPTLRCVDVAKVRKVAESGLDEHNDDDNLLGFLANTAASFTNDSYDYAQLAGRLEMIQLYRHTEDTFTKAMLSIESLLDPFFVKKIKAYDYSQHIEHENDFTYDIIGVRTLLRSYLLKDNQGKTVERPQYLLMRVAVFLNDDLESVLKTYFALSEKFYTHASPTLFHCGMKHHQLASCFLLPVVDDSIEGIYDTLKNCALISKSAGGIGISVSNIRAKGTFIHGTNGTSNGLVPMLRVFNNTARFVDQGGGRRKGAFAVFIEPWHADVEDVIRLKLNHGEEHSRARDLFYSIWIPDKFMRAIENDEDWYLFCPTSVPTLQDSYGETFDALYDDAVEKKLYVKKLKARELWSLITKTQIETGGPYLMYKNAVNTKSNQQNLGTIRSSNLCAEICEYSSKDEVAVCTLASICLPRFINRDGFNFKKLQKCAYLICKNLNKVIDKTSYPLKEAEYSNRKNRPMGIGVQGLADVFHQLHMAYDSTQAMEMNERIFETIYYGAMTCSIDLAEKNAPYASFEGSPLSNGNFQFDLWNVTPKYFDWDTLRDRVKQHGAVNSLLVALMPTASSAQINSNTEGMEPVTSNLYVRRVLSGEFMVLNKNLEMACRKLGLWNEELVNQIIKDRGSVQQTNLPDDIKKVYKTVWEISNRWIIDHAAKRAPFVCQSQSMNLYLENGHINEGTISSMQFYAWKQGLKTGQYYLRTRAKANAVQFSCESCSA